MPADLSDEALVKMFDAAYREATRDLDGPDMADQTLASLHATATSAGIRAVLRGLAEGCDEEGLHQIAVEAELAWIRAHPYPPAAKEPMLLWAVRAVATRLRAESAAREAALRELAHEAFYLINAVITDATHEPSRKAAEDRLAEILANPSPAVQRTEAEARLGRARLRVVLSEVAYHPDPMSPDPITPEAGRNLAEARHEEDAALAALRALDEIIGRGTAHASVPPDTQERG
jgi:hypothetical protein